MTGRRRDHGAADALGLVLIAPASIGLALLVISLGRRVDSAAQARSAAEAAAQAAALERDAPTAAAAARQVAAAMLLDADSCAKPLITIDISEFRPGGQVSVRVECHVARRGVEAVQRSELSYSASATASVDRFRAEGQR